MDIDKLTNIYNIVNIINSNMYTEKYDDWVTHSDPMVRYALVCNNFKPELFIYDDNTMIRSEALKRRPDLQQISLQDLVNNPNNLEKLNKILSKQIYIDINILTDFVSTVKKFKLDCQYEAYKVKLLAIQNELTPFEKELSPYQLFKQNNPSWAREFNSESIQAILEMSEYLDNIDDKEFERYFTPEIQPKGGKITLRK